MIPESLRVPTEWSRESEPGRQRERESEGERETATRNTFLGEKFTGFNFPHQRLCKRLTELLRLIGCHLLGHFPHKTAFLKHSSWPLRVVDARLISPLVSATATGGYQTHRVACVRYWQPRETSVSSSQKQDAAATAHSIRTVQVFHFSQFNVTVHERPS